MSLSPRQKAFATAYAIGGNGAEAARQAGYTSKNPKDTAQKLLSNPEVAAEVDRVMREWKRSKIMGAEEVLYRLSMLAQADITQIADWDGSHLTPKKFDDIPPDQRQCIKSIRADKNGVSVEITEPKAALETMARHHGVFERYRQSRRGQDAFTQNVLGRLKEGEIDAVTAALELEMEGLALPESLRILLGRSEPEPPDPSAGQYAVLSLEEMEARIAARRKELEGQTEVFLPNRQQEVREIKEERDQRTKARAERGEESSEENS